MGKNVASIDIGTHTARILIVRQTGPPEFFRPLFRKRTYIRLGEDFDYLEGKGIHANGVARAARALQGFSRHIEEHDVHTVLAVATGIVREASNRDQFLGFICENAGFNLKVRAIGGDEEAILTGQGVLHALGIQKGPFLIFDLGGGSTEFLVGGKGEPKAASIPIGAVTLTQKFLKVDPPDPKEIIFLSNHIDDCLKGLGALNSRSVGSCTKNCPLIGSGGTVTTLAVMLNRILPQEIVPDRINGLVLKRSAIEALFDKMKTAGLKERLELSGLDRGRAGVVLAGTLVVLRLLYFLKLSHMTASLSDLLEGIIVRYFEGEENE
jgi:exopolyphosphatase/guanosine-5'-triphosphate,3'-diphosphate pyrophosphatase